MKTFWLSFVNETGFAGVCIVEVSEEEAAAQRLRLHPNHQPDAEWIAAAMEKAWERGCNPGGQMSSYELPDDPSLVQRAPYYRLMQRDELERLKLIEPKETP